MRQQRQRPHNTSTQKFSQSIFDYIYKTHAANQELQYHTPYTSFLANVKDKMITILNLDHILKLIKLGCVGEQSIFQKEKNRFTIYKYFVPNPTLLRHNLSHPLLDGQY